MVQHMKEQEEPITFKRIKEYIDIIASGKVEGVLIIGKAGFGKTYLARKRLEDKDIKYAYISGNSAPTEIYKELYENRDGIIILDDLYAILSNQRNKALLLSALQDYDGKKVISWRTSHKALQEIPPSFEFTGKIIIICNELYNSGSGLTAEALKSRFITCRVYPDYKETVKCINYVSENQKREDLSEDERKHILNFLFEVTDETTANLSVRLYNQFVKLYLSNPEKWRGLALEQVEATKEDYKELLLSDLPPREKIKVFVERTGKSKRTFYRWKHLVGSDE